MFKLLSKEANIFSIPLFLLLLVAIVISVNIFNFNTLSIISAIITFIGIALGYFLFNSINLTYNENLPYFIYTFLVFGLYPGHLDIGIATTLLTNSFILLILTNSDSKLKGDIYVLVGSILAIGLVFLPTTYPLAIFVIIHIFINSDRIGLNLVRLFLGAIIVVLSYFSIAYFSNFTTWDPAYLPLIEDRFSTDYYPIYYLSPILILFIWGIIKHYTKLNLISPTDKYKYNFLFVFVLSQLVIIFLYMGTVSEYLLLLVFPMSIVLTRMLKYLPKYWMQELSLWLIIFSVVIYKAAEYFDLNILNLNLNF